MSVSGSDVLGLAVSVSGSDVLGLAVSVSGSDGVEERRRGPWSGSRGGSAGSLYSPRMLPAYLKPEHTRDVLTMFVR